MTQESMYPTRREKANYKEPAAKIEKYHRVTSSSIVLFRKTYGLLIFIYMLLLVISGFELLANLMADGPLVRARTVSVGVVLLMATLIAVCLMMHNQILLILGHGYKEKSAQLCVDKLTTLNECCVSLKLIRTMYVLAIFMPAISLLPLWWFVGAESIPEQVNIQLEALRSLWAVLTASGDVVSTDYAYKNVKWYLWALTAGLGLASIIGVMGWLQAVIARSRV